MTKKEKEDILVGVPSNLRPAFEKMIALIEKKSQKVPTKSIEKKENKNKI